MKLGGNLKVKYGIVVYEESNNIGDDIQSYAAAQLLPKVDYLIEREHLDIFRPKEGEIVNVIINGWLMYNKLGWPVSQCINPLYISVHFRKDDPLGIKDDFLKGLGGEELRKFQPIGCRDLETQQFLSEAGFETWFSGCVTLTLEAKFPVNNEKYICLTDVDPKVEEYIKTRYPAINIKRICHVSENARRSGASWEKRFKEVEKLLEIYQNAEAVITTRLHCALPCLALKTPVLLLNEEEIEENGRFDGLGELLHCTSTDKFINGNGEFDLEKIPQNPEGYLKLREKIKNQVAEFLKKSENYSEKMKKRFSEYDLDWEKRAAWKNELIIKAIDNVVESQKAAHLYMDELNKGKNWLEEKCAQQQIELDDSQKQNENLQATLKELQSGKDWLESKYYEYQSYNSQLEDSKQKLEKERNALQEAVNKMQEELKKKREESERIREEFEKAQEEGKKLKEINNNIQKELEVSEANGLALLKQKETMENSSSWKIGRAVTFLPRKIETIISK